MKVIKRSGKGCVDIDGEIIVILVGLCIVLIYVMVWIR